MANDVPWHQLPKVEQHRRGCIRYEEKLQGGSSLNGDGKRAQDAFNRFLSAGGDPNVFPRLNTEFGERLSPLTSSEQFKVATAPCRDNPAASEALIEVSASSAPEAPEFREPLVQWGEVQRYLELIGRDKDERLIICVFPPKPQKGERRQRMVHLPYPADGIDAGRVERELSRLPKHSLGIIPNRPLPVGKSEGVWGASNTHIADGVALWAEADGGISIEEQEKLPQSIGMPEPTFSVWTGGKSLHHYWVLEQPIPAAKFRELMQRLAHALMAENGEEAGIDTALHNPSRVMRLAGGLHGKTKQRARIHSIHPNQQHYSADQLDELLPKPSQSKATKAPRAAAAPTPGHTPAPEEIGPGKSKPWEGLATSTRLAVLREMLKHGPARLGPDSNTYENARDLCFGLVHEVGDAGVAYHLLEQSGWIALCDEAFVEQDLEKLLLDAEERSESGVAESSSDKGPSTIGNVIRLCTKVGNKTHGRYLWPKWANKPQVAESIDTLEKIIEAMNYNEGDAIKMAVLEGEAKRLGVSHDRLYELRLNTALGTTSRSRSVAEIAQQRRKDNPDDDVIDGFLRRKVTALPGASNAGKTTLAAFFVSKVLRGNPLAISGHLHNVNPGKVLWLTSDCSDEAVEDELKLQGIRAQDYRDQLRISDGASFNNMLAIVEDLKTFEPDLVVLDCLSSMAVNGVSVADPAFSKPLRTLQTHNGKAWRRAGFLVLHHTSRDQPVRFSGGEQIKAAVEEMWVYFDPLLTEKKKPGERMKPTVESACRKLWFEKSRSGFRGKQLTVHYEAMQNQWRLVSDAGAGMDPRSQLDHYFRSVRDDAWHTASEWAERMKQEQNISMHPKTLKRSLDVLARGGLLDKERRHNHASGKARDHYRGSEALRRMAAESDCGTRDRSGKNEIEGD